MTTSTPEAQEPSILATDEVSKHFGAVRAVDRLSISIPGTGVTSIVGAQRLGEVHPR